MVVIMGSVFKQFTQIFKWKIVFERKVVYCVAVFINIMKDIWLSHKTV